MLKSTILLFRIRSNFLPAILIKEKKNLCVCVFVDDGLEAYQGQKIWMHCNHSCVTFFSGD